ncbi:MAG TPA: hypothetical protein VGP93_15215 [Polyangiaceae bacterium]|nr:hypothetical protein [Polyangiaceae bacterium]
MPHPQLGLITITLGILLTLRKLDVGHRLPAQHPGVALGDFELWKSTAMRAYGFGVWACFLKVIADFFGAWLFSHVDPGRAARMTIGISLDVAWVVSMIATFVRVRRTHALAERVGVEVRTPAGGAQDDEDDNPMKAGSEGSSPPPAP